MTRRARFFQATLAVVIGTVVTLLSICALAMLNRSEVAEAQVEGSVRTVSLDGGGGGSPTKGSGGEPEGGEEVATKSDEVMSVNLDAPVLDSAPAIAALDISPALPAPNVAAIPVFVGHSGNIATPGATVASASLSRGVPGGSGQGTGTGGTGNGRGGGSGGGNGTGTGTGSGSGAGDADQIDQPPREFPDNPKPRYPERERQLGIGASFFAKLLIDERGRVLDVKFESGPESFRQSVREAIPLWRLEPGRHKGKAVKVWARKEFKFNPPKRT